jgi:hypothetical protein
MPKVNETISIISTDLEAMGKVYVIIESISIQTFRDPIRTLLRIVNEGVSVVESLAKNLQDGAVRITRNIRVNLRNRDGKVNNRSKNSRTNMRDKDVNIHDRSNNTKTYKRGGSVKGEDR